MAPIGDLERLILYYKSFKELIPASLLPPSAKPFSKTHSVMIYALKTLTAIVLALQSLTLETQLKLTFIKEEGGVKIAGNSFV